MKLITIVKAAALIAALVASNANAAVQTWRLTARIDTEQWFDPGFTPPAFASPGAKVVIDYLIEDQGTVLPSNGSYEGVIKSVTFNGETSTPSYWHGYVLAWDWLNAVNAGYWSARSQDGVDFISLNNFNPSPQASLTLTLLDIARNIPSSNANLRFDFGSNNSVYAIPLSLTPIPEPGMSSMVLVGMLTVLVARRRAAKV